MIFRPLVSLKKGGLVPPSGLVTLHVFPLLFNEERANLVAEFWWDQKNSMEVVLLSISKRFLKALPLDLKNHACRNVRQSVTSVSIAGHQASRPPVAPRRRRVHRAHGTPFRQVLLLS